MKLQKGITVATNANTYPACVRSTETAQHVHASLEGDVDLDQGLDEEGQGPQRGTQDVEPRQGRERCGGRQGLVAQAGVRVERRRGDGRGDEVPTRNHRKAVVHNKWKPVAQSPFPQLLCSNGPQPLQSVSPTDPSGRKQPPLSSPSFPHSGSYFGDTESS